MEESLDESPDESQVEPPKKSAGKYAFMLQEATDGDSPVPLWKNWGKLQGYLVELKALASAKDVEEVDVLFYNIVIKRYTEALSEKNKQIARDRINCIGKLYLSDFQNYIQSKQ